MTWFVDSSAAQSIEATTFFLSMSATWESVDPRNGNVVAYDALTCKQLEDVFLSGEPEFHLIVGGAHFTIRFGDMRQYNSNGGSRQVIRRPRPPPAAAPVAATTDDATADACLALVSRVDTMLAPLLDNLKDRRYRWKPLPMSDVQPLLRVYDEILCALSSPSLEARYRESCDRQLIALPLGSPVPAYFANVKDGGVLRRKVLSVLGLRNLVVHGGEIFNELAERLFTGNESEYRGTGLAKMRHLTGNTVDLDTMVLNPQRQFASLAPLLLPRRFRSADEFERDPLCRDMVLNQAKPLIDAFIDALHLTPQEQQQRRIVLPAASEALYRAMSNSDRGTRAVWHYQNVGVSTYHVNVPALPDVIGALLRAPFHLVKAYIIAKRSTDMTTAMDEFFEDAISDSCFNGKWKAVELYLDKWCAAEDINVVLSKLQETHQAVFREFLQDDDRNREGAAMLRLVREAQLTGVDPSTKEKRLITEMDIKKWIELTDG